VARQHFAISLVQPMQYPCTIAVAQGYNGQFFLRFRQPPAAAVIFLLSGRFWIDQKLKKKMGH